MKQMSKFFLIVSSVIIGIGIIICIIGAICAKAVGVQLFPQKTDGKYIYTVDLTDTEISKFSVSATDADITVHTGCDKEYAEFINFNENYYSLSTTNRVISFSEYVDLTSITSFWESDFSFKGMRSVFRLASIPDGNKEINIYLANRDITVFDFALESGNITVSDLNGSTDFKFSLDNGNINLKNITTDSKVEINAANCEIVCDNCNFKVFSCDCANIELSGDISDIHSFNLNSKSGTVNCKAAFDTENQSIRIITGGTILINGEVFSKSYSYPAEDTEVTDEYAVFNITGETLTAQMTADLKDNTSNVKKSNK